MENIDGQQIVMEEGSAGTISQSPQISLETETQVAGQVEMLRSEHLQLGAQATVTNMEPLIQSEINGKQQRDSIEISQRGSQLQIPSEATVGQNGRSAKNAQHEMIEWQPIEKATLRTQGQQGLQIQITEMQMPEGMQSQQLGSLEGSEILEQISQSDMTTQEPSQHKSGWTIQMQDMPIQQYSMEIQTQQMSFAECGGLQEEQLETDELTIQEMPLELIDQGMQMQELSAQEKQKQMGEMTMPVNMSPQEGMQMHQIYAQEKMVEIQSQDMESLEEGVLQEHQLQMIEMTTQEIVFDMRNQGEQTQEMSAQKIPEMMLEIQSEEIGNLQQDFVLEGQLQTSEMNMQETSVNTSSEGMQMQKIHGVEMCKDKQQLPSQEVMKEQVSLNTVAEQRLQMQEMKFHEIRQEFSSQEIGHVEEGLIQEQEILIEERASQQICSGMIMSGIQMEEKSMHAVLLKTHESSYLEGVEIQLENRGHEMQMAEMSLANECLEEAEKKIQQVDSKEVQSKEIFVQEDSWSIEVIGTIDQQTPEQSWGMEVIGTIDEQTAEQSLRMEVIGTIEQQTPEQSWDMEVIGTIEQQTPQQSWNVEVTRTIVQQTSEKRWDMEVIGTIEEETADQSLGMEVIGTIEQQTQEQSWAMEVARTIDQQTKEQTWDMEVIGTITQRTTEQSWNMEVTGTTEEQTPEQSWNEEVIETIDQQTTPEYSCSIEVIGNIDQPIQEQSSCIAVTKSIDSQNPEKRSNGKVIETIEQQDPEESAHGKGIETIDHRKPDQSPGVEVTETTDLQKSDQSSSMEGFEAIDQQKPKKSSCMEAMEKKSMGLFETSKEQETQEVVKKASDYSITNTEESTSNENGKVVEEVVENIDQPILERIKEKQENVGVDDRKPSNSQHNWSIKTARENDSSSKDRKPTLEKQNNEVNNKDLEEDWSTCVVAILQSNESQSLVSTDDENESLKKQEQISSSIAQGGSCGHKIIIDEYLERITRLEKERHYLEGRYDELRTRGGQVEQNIGEGLSEDNDHSSIMDHSATPLDLRLENHHDVDLCLGEIESPRCSDRLLADKAYYKSKYEEISREKERLERACETERKQKEGFEMDCQNEKDEKFYLEQRCHEMVQHLNRFEETIRSLRQDNKFLQKNLNEWATSKLASNQQEATDTIAGQMVDGDHSTWYRKHLETLERENKEFRSIFDVLSKKNEKEEGLEQIELGFARENELIELRREKVRLEDSLRELKRTNKHQQEGLEEMRNESAKEILQHREKGRKLEKTIKEKDKMLDEKEDKEDKIDKLKKRHCEEVHVLEIRLQNEVSRRSQVQNQMRDLEVKVQLLEQERSHLREVVRASSSAKDQQFGMDSDYQDEKMIRQRYEDERRSKFKLASDIKFLRRDIMDLKDRNRKLQEDFTRKRIEIKAMIEKQANDITQVYLLQVNKLQRSLMEETKRRQEAEAGQSRLLTDWIPENNGTFITDATETNSFPHSNMQAQLRNEIQRRNVLEIENRKLLHKTNELLSSNGNYSEEIAPNNKDNRRASNQREIRDLLRSNDELNEKNRELESEVEDLNEKLEELKKDARKKNELSRRNDQLEEEVTHLNRKREELLAAQRNLTREIDNLSNNLDEAELRNRKLVAETKRLTQKIQEIEDSFRQDKIVLRRHYENEKERTVQEMNKMKETAEKSLYEETEKTRQLTDIVRKLEEAHGSDSKPVKRSYGHGTFPTNANFPFGGSGDFSTKTVRTTAVDTAGIQVERWEKMLQDVNKRHEAELENLNLQKKNMAEEFLKDKQSLEQYFEQENAILQKRLLDVENSMMLRRSRSFGIATAAEGEMPEPRSFHSMNSCFEETQSRLTPGGDAMSRKTNVERERWSPIENTMYDGLNNPPRPGNNSSKLQMKSMNDQEKSETLYHVTEEKRRLEDEVQQTNRKLKDCRRLFEDEIEDLKRKHRRELDYLNDKLMKERAEFEETLLAERNASKTKFCIPAWNTQNEQGHSSKIQQDIQELKQESQKAALKAGFEREKQEVYRKMQEERKKVMETIQNLKQVNNALKCENRELKNCYKKELEKLKRVHDTEKVRIQQKAEGDSAEEASRLNYEYQHKLTSERRRLQSSIDEFRQKLSMAEKKMKDMEMEHKEEKERYEEEKRHTQSSLIQTKEELKVVLERDYRKKLSDERQKFEQTIESLTQKISLLQNQRKEMQAKLLNIELMGKYKTNSDQLSRRTVVVQLEEEFLERVHRERRPMEEKIRELQQEISKHKKEKKELKATSEKEKQELEEEMENLKENMTRKLSKAREKMDQKTEALELRSIMSNKIISLMQGGSGASNFAPNQANVRQYKDEVNMLEQRNMTLQAKTERLERELRVMSDRLRTLETRNKNLEAANREEWTMVRDEIERQNSRYVGGLEFLGSNDTSLGWLNTGMFQRNYALTPNLTYGVSSMMGGPSYGDILERVRNTMHSTGSFTGTIGGSELDHTSFGPTNTGQTEMTETDSQQNPPMVPNALNQDTIIAVGRNRAMGGRSEMSSNLQSKMVK